MKQLEMLYEGKAKQVFRTDDDDVILMHYKDAATAFNNIKKATIEGKGVLNNKISTIIFGYLKEAGIPTHYISTLNERDQLCRRVKIIPLEVIVRNIVAGSMAKRLGLEEGLRPSNTIYDICYKCDELGDPLINDHHAVALGVVTYDELKRIYDMTAKINEVLTGLFDRMNITLVYRLSLPVMIGGLIALALVFGERAPLAVLLIATGYELFDILAWVLFGEIARRMGPGAAPYVFGVGVAYMLLGMAAGYVASAVMIPLVDAGVLQLSAVALVAVLCLVIIAFLVLPESVISSIPLIKGAGRRTEKPADDQEEHPEPQLTLEQKCAGVAEACGLTPREREVLQFLARGRTLSIVARDLHIAKNTARTHIEKIYQKTDIHKQQDLIDFVEGWEER